MLNHTKRVKEIYNDIQKKIYYMIPEKWEELHLYASVLDNFQEDGSSGELFFYYYPKGIIKKKLVNVYEIPNKFNLDESEYIKIVKKLYEKIKELREQLINQTGEKWSNITINIKNAKFKVTYDYTNLSNSILNSYERHVVWRYENLDMGTEKMKKDEKKIINSYLIGPKTLENKEYYEAGIYLEDKKNIIGYRADDFIVN